MVNTLQREHLIQSQIAGQTAWTYDLQSIVEKPDFRSTSFDTVVAMGDRIEQRFLPREFRVFRNGAKAGTNKPRRPPQQSANRIECILNYCWQVALDPGAFLDVVFGPGASFRTDDPKHTDTCVGMIRTKASKQKFGCSAELDPITTSVRELAFEQIIFVGPCGQPRPMPRACKERAVKIVHAILRKTAFPAFGQPLQLERTDMGFTCLDRLVADAQREAVPRHLDRDIRGGHVKNNERFAITFDQETRGLWRQQSRTRSCQQSREGIIGKIVARDSMIVFDTQNQNAAFRVGKSGHIFGHLVPDGATFPGAFGTLKPLEQRLAFEVLALVLMEEGCDIEDRNAHRFPPFNSPSSRPLVSRICCLEGSGAAFMQRIMHIGRMTFGYSPRLSRSRGTSSANHRMM